MAARFAVIHDKPSSSHERLQLVASEMQARERFEVPYAVGQESAEYGLRCSSEPDVHVSMHPARAPVNAEPVQRVATPLIFLVLSGYLVTG